MAGGETADALEDARARIRGAKRIVVLTGAGVSADSGVPTFRGAEGLWKRWRPEELATPQAFGRDPRLVWEWYAWRRARVAACAPNAAHLALARLALGRAGVTLVTQNVDGLHDAAARAVAGVGDPAAALPLELHGSLFRVRCTRCGEERPHRDAIDASAPGSLPRCATCAGLLRPAVVWFGEPLPRPLLERALSAAADADVCLVIGTSAVVYPAAGVADAALAGGAALVEVNPEPTAFTPRAAAVLRARAAAVVPALVGG